MAPSNGISEHWLLRGIQSAFFYYFSCGPCIGFETKIRRQTQARRERKQRQRARRERMEYKRRKQKEKNRTGADTGDEEDEDGDHVVEMAVTDPTGSSRVIGVGLLDGQDEHTFLPFEVNAFWSDENNPSSEEPWWWQKLTGTDPDAAEPSMPIGTRGLGRKRYFRPFEKDCGEEPAYTEQINRDDGDLWPLNDSHPPVLCKDEITREEVAWIKEPPPDAKAMKKIQRTLYEVDLDKLAGAGSWRSPLTAHPAVTRIHFDDSQAAEKQSVRSSKSSTSKKSPNLSPRNQTSGFEAKKEGGDSPTKLMPTLSSLSSQFLSPPLPKLERAMTPTGRPDSAISASRLKSRRQPSGRRKRSSSHAGTSSSDDVDADDEDEDIGFSHSPKSTGLSRPKASYQRSMSRTQATSQNENVSPKHSPQTLGSAMNSSDSLAGDSWLPPKMLAGNRNASLATAGAK